MCGSGLVQVQRPCTTLDGCSWQACPPLAVAGQAPAATVTEQAVHAALRRSRHGEVQRRRACPPHLWGAVCGRQPLRFVKGSVGIVALVWACALRQLALLAWHAIATTAPVRHGRQRAAGLRGLTCPTRCLPAPSSATVCQRRASARDTLLTSRSPARAPTAAT